MNEKEQLAKNIAFCRKKIGLTQKELAEQLSYSDKTVSKWETGESYPDVFVLKRMSEIFQVPIDTLLSDMKVKAERNDNSVEMILADIKRKRKLYMLMIAIAILLIVGTVAFVLCTIAQTPFRPWLIFIYEIPLITLAVFIFVICTTGRISIVCMTIFIWTTILSVQLSFLGRELSWMYYLIGIPLELLAIFYGIYMALGLKKKKLKQLSQTTNQQS